MIRSRIESIIYKNGNGNQIESIKSIIVNKGNNGTSFAAPLLLLHKANMKQFLFKCT